MFELVDSAPSSSAVINVVGVGGGGGNAVNHMVESSIAGVEFICANTHKVNPLNTPHSRTGHATWHGSFR